MTIESSDVLRVFYIMNGAPDLPFQFPVAQTKDVRVFLKDLTTLISVELTEGVDYTVTLTNSSDLPSVGSVTILSDTIYNDTNYKVSIMRDTEAMQPYNLEFNQEMNPKELELELDRAMMVIQDLTDRTEKDSIKIEVTGEELENVIKVPTYGMAVVMTPDGIDTVPMELVDGAIQIVNVKIATDDTLDGDGTEENPLSVSNTLANTLHLNGFDLQDRDSMGVPSFDVGTMTFTITPVNINPIKFYANGNQFSFNTAKTCVMSPALETGMYYFYFDNTGVISYIKGEDIFSKVFYEYAICGGIYYNSSYPDEYRLIEERHGYRMSSATHERLHFADGCRYSLGFEPDMWNIGETTYGSIGRGFCHDEDIRHDTKLAVTHRFMYKIGADKGTWRFTDKNNEAGLKLAGATYYSYNYFDGTNWGLKEGESDTDFWIMFQVFFPSAVDNYNSGEIILMLGQEAYKNASTARNAVETEMSRLKQDGLPSYEMVFLQAYIIKRNGKIVDIDGEGNVFYNIAGVDYGSTNGGGIVPDVQVLPPIAVIDGATTTPLAGTEFDGFIDATPNHITTTVVKAGTKYTTTKDGASTLHEITTDTPIPIGDDGDYTVWVDKDRLVTLGESLGLVKKVTYDDKLPAFSDYTLAGVGTVSVSSEYDTSTLGWKALNKTILDNTDNWLSATTTGQMTIVLDNPIVIDRFSLTSVAQTYYDRFPKDFTFKYSPDTNTPSVTAKTVTGASVTSVEETVDFNLDSQITVKSYMIDVTANNGSTVMGFAKFDVYEAIQHPYYDIATGNLYEGDVAVEKCPVGQVTVAGGAITSINSFYHGTKASVAINGGSNIGLSTRYNENLPFFALNNQQMLSIYHQDKWGWVGVGSAAYCSACRIYDNSLIIQTTATQLEYKDIQTAGDFSTSTNSALAKVDIQRGY